MQLPDTYGEFMVTGRTDLSVTRFVDYSNKDAEILKAFTVYVATGPDEYSLFVDLAVAPRRVGEAVCESGDDGAVKECAMAGTDGVLRVSSAIENMTVEDLAQILQDFYALP